MTSQKKKQNKKETDDFNFLCDASCYNHHAWPNKLTTEDGFIPFNTPKIQFYSNM